MARIEDVSLDNLSEDEMEVLKEVADDQKEDEMEDQMDMSSEMQEAYGYPQQEEKHNAHTFLSKAAFSSNDTVKTTYLSEWELGRPLFSVRFLSDLHDLSKHYLDDIFLDLGLIPEENNKIAKYFWEKIQNITNSGMSNKGFTMNLNVTQKKDMVRKRIRTTANGQFASGEAK